MTHIDKMVDVVRLQALADYVSTKQDGVVSAQVNNRELTLVCRRQKVLDILKFLRDDRETQFKMLLDICGVDWPQKEDRFEVVYHLLSISKNLRVRVKVAVKDGAAVASATGLFSSANWYERETYDMFGIQFENHPDLRRLLTDYDFDGHPLRKDFPLNGHVEVYYDEKEKRVAYKPVDMPQAFRHFDKQSPWQAMNKNSHLAENDNVFDAEEFNSEHK